MDEPTVLVPHEALRNYCREILVRLEVPPEQAEIVATTLVEADLRGVESHGANMLARYVDRLRAGHLRARTEIRVLRDDGQTALLDGGRGLGQVAGVYAIDLAIEKARRYGVGVVLTRESSHLGALAYYTLRAAERGFFAMVMQNVAPGIPPYGGITPILSTNPFSYAVPAGEEYPIVLDMATTAVAGGKLILARKRGDRTIPEGWAVDAQGRPTTDPFAAEKGHLQWAGGYKGYGIAMLVEIMAGVLSGNSFGRTDVLDAEPKGRERVLRGHFFLALDIERFMPLDEFRRRVDTLIRDIHSSEPAAGVERVYVPGEPEHLRRAQRLRDGIPLATAVVRELEAIGRSLGMGTLAAGT